MSQAVASGSGRRPRRQAPAAERRAQILAAALRCFSAKGYHSATMDDLAREAGLSKGSLYWHFASKQEVFLALCGAYTLELLQAWQDEASAHEGGVVELIRRVGELTLERVLEQEELLSAWAQFIVHREAQEQFAAIYRASRAVLGGWMREGAAAGELRGDLDPDGLAAAATAGLEGLLIQRVVDPAFDVRGGWRAWWAVFERGVQA